MVVSSVVVNLGSREVVQHCHQEDSNETQQRRQVHFDNVTRGLIHHRLQLIVSGGAWLSVESKCEIEARIAFLIFNFFQKFRCWVDLRISLAFWHLMPGGCADLTKPKNGLQLAARC